MSFFKNPEIPKSSVIAKIDHFKEPSAKKDVPRWFSNSSLLKFSLNSNQKDRKYHKEIKICDKIF